MKLKQHPGSSEEGIVIPVILWWLGVPFLVVLLLWFLVF
ncbi:hypothetical protein BH20VER1_BH20VER1_17090 [soil metagenome]